MLLRFLFILTFIVTCHSLAWAGPISDSTLTCTQRLNRAQKVYDAGKIAEVEALLTDCIKDGFTREEKMQALRLLTLAYLFQDEQGKAEKKLLELLHEDPEYKLNPAIDPAEFYQLYNQYRTLPIVSIGIVGGVNRTGITERQAYSVSSVEGDVSRYKSRTGFQAGVLADILLLKNIQINAGALWNLKRFTHEQSLLYDNYSLLTSSEDQMWLDIPVALKYVFGQRKFRPFVLGGVSSNLLLTAKSTLSRENTDNSSAANEGAENFRKQRKLFSPCALFGVGARYKVGYGYLSLDARFQYGLNNVTNSTNRFLSEDGKTLFYYGYVSSDFSVNNLAFTVGYYKSFYKPKKIKIKDLD